VTGRCPAFFGIRRRLPDRAVLMLATGMSIMNAFLVAVP